MLSLHRAPEEASSCQLLCRSRMEGKLFPMRGEDFSSYGVSAVPSTDKVSHHACRQSRNNGPRRKGSLEIEICADI